MVTIYGKCEILAGYQFRALLGVEVVGCKILIDEFVKSISIASVGKYLYIKVTIPVNVVAATWTKVSYH